MKMPSTRKITNMRVKLTFDMCYLCIKHSGILIQSDCMLVNRIFHKLALSGEQPDTDDFNKLHRIHADVVASLRFAGETEDIDE